MSNLHVRKTNLTALRSVEWKERFMEGAREIIYVEEHGGLDT